LLAGHFGITEEDWQLAGILMGVSDLGRQVCIDAVAAKNSEANQARAEAEAARAVIVEDRTTEAAIKRACGVIMRKLRKAGDWVPRADLRSHLGRERHHFEAAIERLLDVGQIETREGEQGGHQYRAVEDR
jgi:hypothetical protein